MNEIESCDYAIVGAGAAGCVLAEALSRNPKCSVIVLESGGQDTSPLIHIPAGKVWALGNPKFDWRYRTEPDPTRNNKVEVWPRGRVVGGSTSINGMFYVRGNPADFDAWSSLGNIGWSYKSVLPYFKEIEFYSGGDPMFRGREGKLTISDVPSPHRLSALFVEAAIEAGIPRTNDYNGPNQEGASLAQTTIHSGFRQSASKAFLKTALKRPNVRVITRAHVEKINILEATAQSLNYKRRNQSHTLHANREVLLCAGAVASPHLLMLSGIGSAEHLKEMGIEPVRDLRGVGKNLQEHCGVWIMQGVRESIRTANMDYNPLGILKHGLKYLLTRDGPVGTPTSQALAFVKSSASETIPDIQIHFMPMGYDITGSSIKVLKKPAMMAVPNVSNPQSRGMIRLASSEPHDAPRIYPRLLDDKNDIKRLISACKIVRKIFSTNTFADVSEEEIFPGQSVQTDEEWEAVLRQYVAPVFHIAGTCRMGQDDMSVVGHDLRVHGIKNLRVIDASIMPIITSGNTNAPTMMIAAKAADMIKQSYT
jgi:choline dehydrogenase